MEVYKMLSEKDKKILVWSDDYMGHEQILKRQKIPYGKGNWKYLGR